MSKTIEEVITLISSGDFGIAVLVLIFIVLSNLKPLNFFMFLLDRKKNDIKHLLMLAESEIFDDDSKNVIREYLEMYSFRECYGIHASKKMRNALTKCHVDFDGKLSWYDLKKSFGFLKLNGKRLSVKLTRWQCLGYWASTIYIGINGVRVKLTRS